MLRHIYVVSGGGRPFWAYLSLAVVSAVLQAVAVLLLFPLFAVMFGPNPVGAGVWLALFVAAIVAVWVVDVLAARQALTLGISIMRAIHGRAPAAVLTWPEAKLTPRKVASLRTLLSHGATEATSGVITMVTPVITAVVFMFALGFGLATISLPVAAVTVVGGVLVLLALWASVRIQARSEAQYARATDELDDRLFEFAWAQPSLRTARSVEFGQRFVDAAIVSTRRRVLGLLLWQIPGEFLFSLVLQIVLFGFGVAVWLLFDQGAITGVTAATLVLVLLRVIEQVTSVSGSVAGILGIHRSLEQVREIVETPETVAPAVPVQPAASPPTIRMRDVTVRYPDGAIGMQGVDLTFQPGTVTVVVGRSGSGKSTLLRALAGLLPVNSGKIILGDAVDRPASEAELCANATVVFQQTMLGAGTVRDNLYAVNPALKEQDFARIADIAQLTSMFDRGGEGWDTQVGEFGAQLSGGERQRIGIARSLAKPAHVLLVDEATAALDASNELSIVQSIDRIRSSYTTVMVTHRPATLAIADVVVVMDGGKVVECGPPAELAAQDGEYARLIAEWKASAAWRV